MLLEGWPWAVCTLPIQPGSSPGAEAKAGLSPHAPPKDLQLHPPGASQSADARACVRAGELPRHGRAPRHPARRRARLHRQPGQVGASPRARLLRVGLAARDAPARALLRVEPWPPTQRHGPGAPGAPAPPASLPRRDGDADLEGGVWVGRTEGGQLAVPGARWGRPPSISEAGAGRWGWCVEVLPGRAGSTSLVQASRGGRPAKQSPLNFRSPPGDCEPITHRRRLSPARGAGAKGGPAQRGHATLPAATTVPHVSVLFMNRPPGSSYFRYAESSMKNSFGLKYLHRFFNIPFLQLQVSPAGRVQGVGLGSARAAVAQGWGPSGRAACWSGWSEAISSDAACGCWRPLDGPPCPLPLLGGPGPGPFWNHGPSCGRTWVSLHVPPGSCNPLR